MQHGSNCGYLECRSDKEEQAWRQTDFGNVQRGLYHYTVKATKTIENQSQGETVYVRPYFLFMYALMKLSRSDNRLGYATRRIPRPILLY